MSYNGKRTNRTDFPKQLCLDPENGRAPSHGSCHPSLDDSRHDYLPDGVGSQGNRRRICASKFSRDQFNSGQFSRDKTKEFDVSSGDRKEAHGMTQIIEAITQIGRHVGFAVVAVPCIAVAALFALYVAENRITKI